MLLEMGPTTVSFARFLIGFVCRKHLNNFYLQTQSQELGAETVVDTDMLYGMGIVSFQYILRKIRAIGLSGRAGPELCDRR